MLSGNFVVFSAEALLQIHCHYCKRFGLTCLRINHMCISIFLCMQGMILLFYYFLCINLMIHVN